MTKMFKKYSLTLIIILLIIIIFGCSKQENHIKSNPILVERIGKSYPYKFGILDTTAQYITYLKYDSLGNEIEEIHKDKTQAIKFVRKTVYKYYPDGKLHELIIYDESGEPIAKYISYYDSNGIKIKEEKITKDNDKKSYRDDNFETSTFKYKDSLLVEEFVLNSKTRYIHSYDDKGFKKESRTYYRNEKTPSWISKYKCDKNGNVIFDESYYVDGKKYKNTRLYKYDSLNREIEEISLDENDKQVFRLTYKYDINNKKIESMDYGSMDEPRSLTKYTYIFK